MDEDPDRRDIRACLEGDLEAFGSIVIRYQKQVMSVAFRILRDPEDARDVAQAVFIKAFDRLSSYDPRYRLFSWLYRIAVNESLNYAVRRKKPVGEETPWKAESPDPEAKLEEDEYARAVDRAVASLKPPQRAVLALCAEGLSYAEIGETLHLSESKVKSRLFEARQRLRDILIRARWSAHD